MADLSIGTTIGGFVAYHAGNYFPTKADVGLNLVNNWGASDSYTTASSTTYATSKAVKDAYDAAVASAASSVAWADITGKPTTFTPAAHVHTSNDISDLNTQNAGAVASTLALRDANADISARLFKSTYADQATVSGALAFRVNNSTDNYIRYCNTPSAVLTWLGGLGASANAVSASKWATARTLTLAGDVTGSVSIDGSANVSITTVIADDSHNHTIANTDGLQAALDAKMVDGGSYGTITFSNWVRTSGQTGWYSATYGGGVYMIDTTWLRSYQNKGFYTAGEGAFGGNVTAYYSDERLKDIDEELDPDFCLAAVNKWRKVRYHANDLGAHYGYKKDKAEIGLLAGEIQKDFPELTPLAPFDFETLEDGTIISKSGKNYRTMNYERIVAVQAAAITALTRRLEQLEEKLNG